MIDFAMRLGFVDDASVVAMVVRIGCRRGVVLSVPAPAGVSSASTP